VISETSIINSLVIKTLKSKAEDFVGWSQIREECFDFIKHYVSICKSWTAFSPDDVETLVDSWATEVAVLSRQEKIQLTKQSVSKKTKNKADLNILSVETKETSVPIHEAALEALNAFLLHCISLVNEVQFKKLLEAVVSECIHIQEPFNRVNAEEPCPSWENRYLLLQALRLLVTQTSFLALRPILPAMTIFNVFLNDRHVKVVNLCQESILSLQLISRPVISPLIVTSSGTVVENNTKPLEDDVPEDEEVVFEDEETAMNVDKPEAEDVVELDKRKELESNPLILNNKNKEKDKDVITLTSESEGEEDEHLESEDKNDSPQKDAPEQVDGPSTSLNNKSQSVPTSPPIGVRTQAVPTSPPIGVRRSTRLATRHESDTDGKTTIKTPESVRKRKTAGDSNESDFNVEDVLESGSFDE